MLKRRNISFLIALLLLIAYAFHDAATVDLPSEDKTVKFYATQCRQDLRVTVKQAISEAQESILLVVYALSDKDVIHLLKMRAEDGLHVTVVTDAKTNYGLKKALGPSVDLHRRKDIKGLMHRKVLVIDGQSVWIGSANFTTESLIMHDNLVCGMHAPKLAKAICEKYRRLLHHTPPAAMPQIFFLDGQQLELYFLPEDKGALTRLLDLLNTAQSTIRVAMFTLTHPKLVDALIAAHERGVQIEVAVDRKSSFGTSASAVKRLKENGIFLQTNIGGNLLHHKFAYIDKHTLCHGSTNWTKAAFTANEEALAILQPLTEEQQTYLDTLWEVVLLQSQSEPPEEKTLFEAIGLISLK